LKVAATKTVAGWKVEGSLLTTVLPGSDSADSFLGVDESLETGDCTQFECLVECEQLLTQARPVTDAIILINYSKYFWRALVISPSSAELHAAKLNGSFWKGAKIQ
jgi:hypothetical protein